MQGSVCVNERCGYRQKGEHRNCPRCGWLMLDGPLPAPGSIAPPPRVLDAKAVGATIAAAAVLFIGAIGLAAGALSTSDPTAHAAPAASTHAAALPPSTPMTEAPAPIATPAPAAVAAAAPASVATKTVAKAPAKAPAKKTVAKKKAPAKKTASKKVARR